MFGESYYIVHCYMPMWGIFPCLICIFYEKPAVVDVTSIVAEQLRSSSDTRGLKLRDSNRQVSTVDSVRTMILRTPLYTREYLVHVKT